MSIEFETYRTIGHCEFCHRAIPAHARGCGDHDWCVECKSVPVKYAGDVCEDCKDKEVD